MLGIAARCHFTGLCHAAATLRCALHPYPDDTLMPSRKTAAEAAAGCSSRSCTHDTICMPTCVPTRPITTNATRNSLSASQMPVMVGSPSALHLVGRLASQAFTSAQSFEGKGTTCARQPAPDSSVSHGQGCQARQGGVQSQGCAMHDAACERGCSAVHDHQACTCNMSTAHCMQKRCVHTTQLSSIHMHIWIPPRLTRMHDACRHRPPAPEHCLLCVFTAPMPPNVDPMLTKYAPPPCIHTLGANSHRPLHRWALACFPLLPNSRSCH